MPLALAWWAGCRDARIDMRGQSLGVARRNLAMALSVCVPSANIDDSLVRIEWVGKRYSLSAVCISHLHDFRCMQDAASKVAATDEHKYITRSSLFTVVSRRNPRSGWEAAELQIFNVADFELKEVGGFVTGLDVKCKF